MEGLWGCPSRPPRAYPASVASLARAPFAGAKGARAFLPAQVVEARQPAPPLWMDVPSAEAPACAGMTRWRGNDEVARERRDGEGMARWRGNDGGWRGVGSHGG